MSAQRTTFRRMEDRFGRVIEILRSRDVPPAPDVSRLDSNNARLARRDWEERARLGRTTIDDRVFVSLGLSRVDWRSLEAEGLIEIKQEVETFYPDPESGRPVERRVNLVSLTDAGRGTIGYAGYAA